MVLVFGLRGHSEPAQKEEKDTNRSLRVDLYGDPLPAGGIARMGTVRGRHAQAISFIAFLPDGKTVLTVCHDQIIRVWDIKTGMEFRRFGEPPNPAQEAGFPGMPGRFRATMRTAMPFHAALSADGKLLACGGQDGPMRMWNVPTGKLIHKINGPGLKIPGGGVIGIPGMMGVSNLALSPDGETVAGAAMDGTIHLWATSSAKEIRQIAQPENQNMPVSIGSSWGPMLFSPDGKTILDSFVEIGNANLTGSMRLWDIATSKKRFEIKNRGMGMYKAVFSPDGRILACSNVEGTVRLFNADSGKELRRLKEAQLWGPLVFSPDERN
jgi:WD40 repeat protein